MKSSAGEHFLALDHVRALAAFMVFAWHFLHFNTGFPVPFGYVPSVFPLSLLAEGHTGVSLFMALSGYLFAKLLDGRRIDYRWFVWNRALRLLPLLAVVILIAGIVWYLEGKSLQIYARSIVWGAIYPSWPNGGWSIAVELHFYLLLPLFLWLLRRSRWLPLAIVAFALMVRLILHHWNGEVQFLAFFTIVGRVDQFVLGMVLYHFRSAVAGRHIAAAGGLLGFAVFYWVFDLKGGFYQAPSFPSPSPLWIVLPTLEGLAYAAGIAWYDNSFRHSGGPVSRFIGRIGVYSYSIYLLHFFVVFGAARFVHEKVMNISNFYLACLWALGCFLLMVPLAYLSHRCIEEPCLKLRRRYVVAGPTLGR